MPLPASGQISFQDLNTDRGIGATTESDLRSTALAYGFTAPDSMDEFYNVPLYDIYEQCTGGGTQIYFVPYFNSNTITSTIGGNCYVKTASQLNFPYITTHYPGVPFGGDVISHDLCSCGGGLEPFEP